MRKENDPTFERRDILHDKVHLKTQMTVGRFPRILVRFHEGIKKWKWKQEVKGIVLARLNICLLKEDCIGGFCNRGSPESLTLDSKHFAGGGFHYLEQTRAEIGQLVYETHIGSNPIALTLHNAIHSIEI